ncbi:hypothetical protein HK098_001378 [Nowakowskiella sp. JEL0407]|nr:hypothetical protein HK098_001378 [Nowakowskiella sp. JEL0407]
MSLTDSKGEVEQFLDGEKDSISLMGDKVKFNGSKLRITNALGLCSSVSELRVKLGELKDSGYLNPKTYDWDSGIENIVKIVEEYSLKVESLADKNIYFYVHSSNLIVSNIIDKELVSGENLAEGLHKFCLKWIEISENKSNAEIWPRQVHLKLTCMLLM